MRASTATLVIASTAIRSAASADVSVTEIVSALLPFASVSVASVARSPLIVAVTKPVVAFKIALNSSTLGFMPVTVTATSVSCVVAAAKPTLLTPAGERLAAASLMPPVRTMFTLVAASIVLNCATFTASVTVMVTASVSAVVRAASVAMLPLIIAVTTPVVTPAIAFSSSTVGFVPVIVTATSASCATAAAKPALLAPAGERAAAASLMPPDRTMSASVKRSSLLNCSIVTASVTVTDVASAM